MRYADELNTDMNHHKWAFCGEKKLTPSKTSLSTDSGPENYSGLPRSRPGTTAAAGSGRFSTVASSKITTYYAFLEIFTLVCVCVCVVRCYGLCPRPGLTPVQWSTLLWSSSCMSAKRCCWVWICWTTLSYSSCSQVQKKQQQQQQQWCVSR